MDAKDPSVESPWYDEYRYGILLLSLFAFMGALAFFDNESWFGRVLYLAFLLPILTSLAAAWKSPQNGKRTKASKATCGLFTAAAYTR